MKVSWLVEDFNEDLGPFISEIQRQGHGLEVVKYVPFESGDYNAFTDDQCVIFHGSLNLMRQLQRQKKWVPGGWCDFKNFECTTYYAHFGKYLLNDQYMMMPLAELLRRKCELLEHYHGHFFVRPSTGFKSFTGQVLFDETFDKDVEWFVEFAKPEDIVVVSEARTLGMEFRFWVAQKKVIAGSLYKCKGETVYERFDTAKHQIEALQFAERVASEIWEPDPLYVIDVVGYASAWRLLEINSFSCSGIYAADPEPLIREASRIALEQWKEVECLDG